MSIGASSRTIYITGDRQSGRTERMIWMVVGAILGGGHPVIATHNRMDNTQTQRRLKAALEQVGYSPREARRLADFSVRSQQRFGATFELVESSGRGDGPPW